MHFKMGGQCCKCKYSIGSGQF